MRRYTEALTSVGRSTRFRRTSMISMPMRRRSLSASVRTCAMIFSRSPETTSCTVRWPNSDCNPSEMVCLRRVVAANSSPCTEVK